MLRFFTHSSGSRRTRPSSGRRFASARVLDGELRLYTSGGTLDYVAGQYSVSAIDTPERGYVLAFSNQQDFLAASIDFTANDVMSVIISLNDELTAQILELHPVRRTMK